MRSSMRLATTARPTPGLRGEREEEALGEKLADEAECDALRALADGRVRGRARSSARTAAVGNVGVGR